MAYWLYLLLSCVSQTAKIGALVDLQDSEDPEGLRVLYYLIQDLKVKRCSSFTRFSVVILGFLMTHFSWTVFYFLAHLAALQDQAHISVPVLFRPSLLFFVSLSLSLFPCCFVSFLFLKKREALLVSQLKTKFNVSSLTPNFTPNKQVSAATVSSSRTK